MSKVTKAEILDRAKGQLDDLVELVSQLIKIPSENPIGSQRPVIDFVEKMQGLTGKKLDVMKSFLVLWLIWVKKMGLA